MIIEIYGEKYKIKMTELEDSKYGFCDFDGRVIVLNSTKDSDICFKSLIHEMTHAGLEKTGMAYEPHLYPYQEMVCELVVNMTMEVLRSKSKISKLLDIKI